MARNWNSVRRDLDARGLIDNEGVANSRKVLDESIRAYRLAAIRKERVGTQKVVAEAMRISQARVSKIERGDLSHTELGTLDAYVAALGGKLRVVADFGDSTVIVEP